MKNQIFRHKLCISNDLLDEYGHVNNARYLDLFERGRWQMLEESKIDPKWIEEQGVGPVVLEINVRFHREICEGENIEIESVVESIEKNKIIQFDQKILNEAAKVCTSAKFKLALMDLRQRRMVEFNPEWQEHFGIH